MSNFDVIVIGAGPAGLLAAGRVAELGGKVLILEKMRQEGRKRMISGAGATSPQVTKARYPDSLFFNRLLSNSITLCNFFCNNSFDGNSVKYSATLIPESPS